MHNSADFTESMAASDSSPSAGSVPVSATANVDGAASAVSGQTAPGNSNEATQKQSQPAINSLDFSDRDHADKVLKDLSMTEFLGVLERSTPEELELMLRNASPVKHPSKRRPLLPTVAARFFALDAPRPDGAVETFCWWEARRVQYNLVVGATGLFTMAVVQLCGFGSAGGFIFAALSYGMMANICYSSGWLSDLLARHYWKEKAEHFGPILYCQGVAFSVLLTLVPAAMAIAGAVLGVMAY